MRIVRGVSRGVDRGGHDENAQHVRAHVSCGLYRPVAHKGTKRVSCVPTNGSRERVEGIRVEDESTMVATNTCIII